MNYDSTTNASLDRALLCASTMYTTIQHSIQEYYSSTTEYYKVIAHEARPAGQPTGGRIEDI